MKLNQTNKSYVRFFKGIPTKMARKKKQSYIFGFVIIWWILTHASQNPDLSTWLGRPSHKATEFIGSQR